MTIKVALLVCVSLLLAQGCGKAVERSEPIVLTGVWLPTIDREAAKSDKPGLPNSVLWMDGDIEFLSETRCRITFGSSTDDYEVSVLGRTIKMQPIGSKRDLDAARATIAADSKSFVLMHENGDVVFTKFTSKSGPSIVAGPQKAFVGTWLAEQVEIPKPSGSMDPSENEEQAWATGFEKSMKAAMVTLNPDKSFVMRFGFFMHGTWEHAANQIKLHSRGHGELGLTVEKDGRLKLAGEPVTVWFRRDSGS